MSNYVVLSHFPLPSAENDMFEIYGPDVNQTFFGE
jgi:hypothetical protein